MINFDDVTKEIKKEHASWPQVPDNPYRILINEDSGSGKTNALFNFMGHQPDIDKIHIYTKG